MKRTLNEAVVRENDPGSEVAELAPPAKLSEDLPVVACIPKEWRPDEEEALLKLAHEMKRKSWRTVANRLNAAFAESKRTPAECKTHWLLLHAEEEDLQSWTINEELALMYQLSLRSHNA